MRSQIMLLPDGRINLWCLGKEEWVFDDPITEAEFIADRREHAYDQARELRGNPEEAANVSELQHRMWIKTLREKGPSGVYYGMAVGVNDALRKTIWRPGGWRAWEREAMQAIEKAAAQ